MADSHFQSELGDLEVRGDQTQPTQPLSGQTYYDSFNNLWWIYNGQKGQWMYAQMTTTTSTSTSTTTTSTSTTTTSTSSSTTTTTSTTTSTSTTTTL